jgi:alpha-amylase
MKKLIAIILLVSVSIITNAKIVKLSVDMTGYTVNANGIHVWGDFQDEAGFATDWDPALTAMAQVGTSNIYEVVINVPAHKTYLYQYINGFFSYEVEFVPNESKANPNLDYRWIYVDSLNNDTTSIGAIRFSGNAPVGQYLLRTKVNMSSETVAAKGVHVAGSNNAWNTTSQFMYSFDNQVYEHMAYIDSLIDSITFKYINGNAAAGYETVPIACAFNLNRLQTMQKDTMLEPICFATCNICKPLSAESPVFANNMSVFPNPASQWIEISNAPINTKSIQIINAVGKLVFINHGYLNSINIENLASGYYILRVTDNTGNTSNRKFSKL